ncbi:hypothetical protein B0H14DRAFT_3483228 [Mycena olivaceomarginata]|nr:hypothetical protein B0H14DRAFT_3483228 [Mycena olivaceomarginata]
MLDFFTTTVVLILTCVVQKIVGELFDWYPKEYPRAEDCLTLNIIKPANATANSKLPVVLVRTSLQTFLLCRSLTLATSPIVQRPQAIGQPTFFLSYQSLIGSRAATQLVQQGKVAAVAFISGDCDDGDAVFAKYYPIANASTISALTTAYTSDLCDESPFGAGVFAGAESAV